MGKYPPRATRRQSADSTYDQQKRHQPGELRMLPFQPQHLDSRRKQNERDGEVQHERVHAAKEK